MNLAIIHYHLNRGGVARVIENQLLALDAVLDPASPWRVAILHGGRKEGWNEQFGEQLRAIDLRLVEVPGLDYDEKGDATLCSALTDALRRLGFAPERSVVQIHNHSLGKNAALSASVGPLANSGYPLLLQIHDFAEDFRPANYKRLGRLGVDAIYPQAPCIHYAVLNGRDHAILRAAGVEPRRLHLLPNPVPTIGQLPGRDDARKKLQSLFDVGLEQRFLLYPVRGIRRKNLGEALLAGLLSPPPTVLGLTLAPLNPAEMPFYAMWKKTAARLGLPCHFEVGAPGALAFAENLAAADAIVTTSLAEGFGMVMLEPWPARRPLLGRDLPEITADFLEAGLRLDRLWNRLDVPLEWVGRERFAKQLSGAYRRAMAAFGRPLPADWQEALHDKIRDDTVDFGDLDEPMQKDVLRSVSQSPRKRQALLEANPGLEDLLAVDAAAAATTMEHNIRVIEARFSLVPSGRRLRDLLLRVVEGARQEPLARLSHPERILDGLLDPRRFRMIRG